MLVAVLEQEKVSLANRNMKVVLRILLVPFGHCHLVLSQVTVREKYFAVTFVA